MKWLFMIFRLKALQRLHRKYQRNAEAATITAEKYRKEGDMEAFEYCCDKRGEAELQLQKIESLIKLLQ